MIICSARHDAGRIDWTEANPSIEASDFGSGRLMGQVYDDACDIGLVLVSPRTGKETVWYLAEEIRTPDGEDIGGWRFKLIPEHARKHPRLANTTLTVWND